MTFACQQNKRFDTIQAYGKIKIKWQGLLKAWPSPKNGQFRQQGKLFWWFTLHMKQKQSSFCCPYTFYFPVINKLIKYTKAVQVLHQLKLSECQAISASVHARKTLVGKGAGAKSGPGAAAYPSGTCLAVYVTATGSTTLCTTGETAV